MRFHGTIHPRLLGAKEVEAFLTHLAVHRKVAASTQNQALNALSFLYKRVLEQPFGTVSPTRAKQPKRLPFVLSKQDVQKILLHLDGTCWWFSCSTAAASA